MRTFTLNLLTLSLGLALMPLAQAANSPQQRQLLEQESYQKKLAEGIAEAISEVYTNTQ